MYHGFLGKTFLALLLQLVGRIIFLVSQPLTISMSVMSSCLDNVIRNGTEVHRALDEFLIGPFFTLEVPAHAIDNANVPV